MRFEGALGFGTELWSEVWGRLLWLAVLLTDGMVTDRLCLCARAVDG